MLMFMLFLMIMNWHVLLLVEEIRCEWIGVHPSIFRVFYIPGGAGFLPSTVAVILSAVMMVVFVLLVVALWFLWHVNTTFPDLYARWTTQGMILHSPKHDKGMDVCFEVISAHEYETCALHDDTTNLRFHAQHHLLSNNFWICLSHIPVIFCQTKSLPKKTHKTRCPGLSQKLLVRVTQLLLVHQSFKRSSLSSAKSHEQRNDSHHQACRPQIDVPRLASSPANCQLTLHFTEAH